MAIKFKKVYKFPGCYVEPKSKYISPLNMYDGTVSILTIMKNIENGHTTWPKNMGNTLSAVKNN